MATKILKWLLYLALGIIITAFISIQAYKAYLRAATKIESPNGISSLQQVQLGETKQWIFIRGNHKENPVLLFLHGGPGEPALGMPGSRILDKELLDHFTIVHWDQLGAGKSYDKNIPNESMAMGKWVEDCNKLINYLCDTLSKKKIFLVAHSGGSILGIKMAQKYPEKIHAYIGISQIVNHQKQQAISYDFILQEALQREKLNMVKKIEKIGPPPYFTTNKEFGKAKYIIKFGRFIRHNLVKNMGIIMLSYLASPEYSSKESINTLSGKGLNFTMDTRYHEINNIDFTSEISSLETPVYFFQGKYDMITPTQQIEEFYQNLKADKGKQLVIFENSAHMPSLEERELYHDLMISKVLKDCLNLE